MYRERVRARQGCAKVRGSLRLPTTIAAGLQIGLRPATAMARLAIGIEITAAIGLLVPVTADGAAILSFVWVAAAGIFWAIAVPSGITGCGCLGTFDPLKRLGRADGLPTSSRMPPPHLFSLRLPRPR